MQPNYGVTALEGRGWLLPAVFSPAECRALIDRISAAGPRDPSPAYPPSYRNNDRLVLEDPGLASEVFGRIAPLVPGELESEGRRFQLVGINPRLRACRYRAGQRFTRHRDGPFCPSPRRRSLLSVVLYLDEQGTAFQGGLTRFFGGQHAAIPIVELRPETGRVAVFAHELWHEGQAVESGIKHVLRSDLVYEAIGEDETSERHAGYVWSLVELADRTLLSSGRDGTIRRWGSRLEALGSTAAETESILCLARSGAARVVGGTRSGRLRSWALSADGLVAERALELGAGAILSVAELRGAPGWSDEPPHDGAPPSVVASAASGELISVAPDGRIGARIQAHDSWAWCARRGPEGTLLSVGEDGCLVESDPARGVISRRQAPGEVPLTALVEDAHGAWISGDRAGRLLRWEPAGPRVIAERRGAVTSLALAEDGSILSGDEAGEVVRLSGSSSTLVHRHQDFVTQVIARAGGGAASCSYDGQVLTTF